MTLSVHMCHTTARPPYSSSPWKRPFSRSARQRPGQFFHSVVCTRRRPFSLETTLRCFSFRDTEIVSERLFFLLVWLLEDEVRGRPPLQSFFPLRLNGGVFFLRISPQFNSSRPPSGFPTGALLPEGGNSFGERASRRAPRLVPSMVGGLLFSSVSGYVVHEKASLSIRPGVFAIANLPPCQNPLSGKVFEVILAERFLRRWSVFY